MTSSNAYPHHSGPRCGLFRGVLILATASLAISATASLGTAVADTGTQPDIQLAQAGDRRPVELDIPAQPLDTALTTLADQADLRLLFDSEEVPDQRVSALRGEFTPGEALRQLLAGTGLDYRFTDTDTVTLTARESDTPTTLAPITVTGEGGPAATTEGTDSYTSDSVTLGGREQSRKDIPQSLSVVTRQSMDDQNVTTVADAMESVTGITVQKWGPFSYDYTTRGYQIGKTLLDGSPFDSDFGSVGTSSLDAAVFDRIEVLRGPAGLLHGAGEPSGTINLVRKRAREEFDFNARGTVGQWDTQRGVVDVTGALDDSGRLRGRFVGVYDDRESFVDHVYQEKQVGYGTLEYDITSKTTISGGVTYQSADSRPHYGLPKYADGRIPDVDRSTNLGALWNENDERIERYFVELEHVLDNGGEFNISANHLERYTARKRSEPSTVVDPVTGQVGVRRLDWYYDFTDQHVQASLSSPFTLLGRTHEAVVGASYSRHETDSEYSLGTPYVVSKDVFDPDNDVPEPAFGTPFVIQAETEQKSVFGKAELGVTSNLTAVAGARTNWWEYRDLDTPANGYEAEGEVTPYTGLIYALTPSMTTYVSYTTIFQPQNAPKVGGSVVEPRTGEQFELGIKGSAMRGQLNWQASVFRISDENRAVADPDNPGFSVSRGKARSEGLEAEISGSPLRQWDISAGYAYTDTEFVRDPENEGLALSPRTPEHNFDLWSRYHLSANRSQGWRVGAGVNAVSEVYVESNDTRWEQEPYVLLSAMVGYRFNSNLDLRLNVENVTDEKYFQTIGTGARHTYYGEPRNAMLTLDYRY